MGIHSDIARLHQKIRECEEDISELEEAREFLRQKHTIIQDEAYENRPTNMMWPVSATSTKWTAWVLTSTLWSTKSRKN